jgi:hypothetical protein
MLCASVEPALLQQDDPPEGRLVFTVSFRHGQLQSRRLRRFQRSY